MFCNLVSEWKILEISNLHHHLIFITALDHYAIRGVTHNIPLLRDILTEPTFLSGTFTTNYLNEVYPEGFKGYQLTKVKVYAYYVTDHTSHSFLVK